MRQYLSLHPCPLLTPQVVIDANKKVGHYISYQFLSRFIGAVDAKWALAISAGSSKGGGREVGR
jgi:hypothetical protein